MRGRPGIEARERKWAPGREQTMKWQRVRRWMGCFQFGKSKNASSPMIKDQSVSEECSFFNIVTVSMV
jgi:hypothetical protein